MRRTATYWIIGSIILQVGLFLYLDKVLFAPAVSFTQQSVFAEEALQTITSLDKTSFAQVAGGQMKVYNHEAGYIGEFAVPHEGEVTYFEYYPDRNMVVTGTTVAKGGSVTVLCQEISTWNREKTEWRLNGLAKGSAIQESAYLGDTGTLHFLLRDGSATYLYRAEKELHRLKTNTTQISRIASLREQELLLFDNKAKGTVYYLNPQGEIKQVSTPKGGYVLIGIDLEDRVYLGQINDKKKVTTLLAGELDGSFVEISKFSEPIDLASLRISREGKLLISP